MHYAIIAAGEGSRLRQEGVVMPKPLVPIQGIPMLGRLIDIFLSLQAESISVICNQESPEVVTYLSQRAAEVPQLHFMVRSTPSSMHSFAALAEMIPEGKFCLTTVDTIFNRTDFKSFIQGFECCQSDGYFAVTPFVDDEKPLWVEVGSLSDPVVNGFHDQAESLRPDAPRLVSGGIYCLNTQVAFPVLHTCIQQGQSRMRNYQRALIAAGLKIEACIFSKIMDIDHAEDIQKAEEWLASCESLSEKV